MTLEEKVELLEKENAELKQQIEELQRIAMKTVMNFNYAKVSFLINEQPRSISELAVIMLTDNRTISQWLHQLKSRFNAIITTLNDGKKKLENPEDFEETWAKFSYFEE